MLMELGLAKMHSPGLDRFIEATDIGKGLYVSCGHRSVKTVSVNMDRANTTDEWKRMTE